MAAKVTFIIRTAFLARVRFYDDCCPNAFGGGDHYDRDDDLCFISPPITITIVIIIAIPIPIVIFIGNYCINGPRRAR
jgi:hypothetical protein